MSGVFKAGANMLGNLIGSLPGSSYLTSAASYMKKDPVGTLKNTVLGMAWLGASLTQEAATVIAVWCALDAFSSEAFNTIPCPLLERNIEDVGRLLFGSSQSGAADASYEIDGMWQGVGPRTVAGVGALGVAVFANRVASAAYSAIKGTPTGTTLTRNTHPTNSLNEVGSKESENTVSSESLDNYAGSSETKESLLVTTQLETRQKEFEREDDSLGPKNSTPKGVSTDQSQEGVSNSLEGSPASLLVKESSVSDLNNEAQDKELLVKKNHKEPRPLTTVLEEGSDTDLKQSVD